MTATLMIPAPEAESVQVLLRARGRSPRAVPIFYMLYQQVYPSRL
jgi:hypothetical protein